MNQRKRSKLLMLLGCLFLIVPVHGQADVSYEGIIAYGLFQQPCEHPELVYCPVDIALVNPASGETTILDVGLLDPGSIHWSPNYDRLSY